MELLPIHSLFLYAFDLSPFGFLLFFPKRKKGAGTLYEIPAPILNSGNEKSTYLLVSKTSGQVLLSYYEFLGVYKNSALFEMQNQKGRWDFF